VFFVRENATGTVLMRSLPSTQILGYGNLGEINLFYGDEVQLAQSSQVDAIKAAVDTYLDVAVSSRLAATASTTLDGIKKNTDLIPGTV